MKRLRAMCVILAVMLFCGCRGKENGKVTDEKEAVLEKSTESDFEQATSAKDRQEAARMEYKLFVRPENAWVGDVMPMADDEGIQIYYLYETENNGAGFHPIYKYSTTNLYEYKNDGLAVPYGTSTEEPDLAIGTGSVIYADGRYHCFYTGHNYMFPDEGKDKECIMHAVSDDNVNWTKLPEDTFHAPVYYDGDNFRDPFVFYNEEDSCYWMLISTRENNKGIIARYTSKDLKDWELSEPLYVTDAHYMMECADVFKLGNQYYLFYSWDLVTYYAVSDSVYGPFSAPEDNTLDGKAFYAAKSAEYNGKRYLFGWIGRKEDEKDTNPYGWAGNMCVYEIRQKEDGRLTAGMPDTYLEYFTEEAAFEEVMVLANGFAEGTKITLNGTKEEIAGVSLGTMPVTGMISGKVKFDTVGNGAGFFFGNSGEFEKAYGILIDPLEGMIRYDNCMLSRIRYAAPNVYSKFKVEAEKEYEFKVVIENEIIVLYMADEKVLSSRIFKAEGAGFGVFSAGGDVTFFDLKLYLPQYTP